MCYVKQNEVNLFAPTRMQAMGDGWNVDYTGIILVREDHTGGEISAWIFKAWSDCILKNLLNHGVVITRLLLGMLITN